ncbi:MAG: ANTAR domain-containing protein [Eubacteriales bacterium]|nr:ANTAR domain-containing protein [Lachnospiraceae bacterium]MDO5127406.1 ANTAR domain-containing protein [Eubacteriales bacterium]
MGSIIIALSKTENTNTIAGIIRGSGLPYDISICDTGAQVLQVANNRDFGVVICSKRLRDMSYIELADMLPECFGTVIFTKDASVECVRHNMVKLMMPFHKSDLLDTIEMVTANFVRKPKKKRELPPKRSDDEKKLIDKAKLVLINRNGMSEPEAFRYIQKNSMDCGRKFVETAQMILTLYSDS